MPLFQTSVLKKYLKTLDSKQLQEKYKLYCTYFKNPERQENIRGAKEEQFQEGFIRELFVEILGYTINPEPKYNITTEFKNENGAKKADGAIIKDGKAVAVIELKGTDTKDLDKINVQAFNYKNNHTGCHYVITSNFEKLRFFIDDSVKHEEFNLFTLTGEKFALFWLCLAHEHLLKGIPFKIKQESLLEEENITKQLYKDYSTFRQDLWLNIVKNNPQKDKLVLFKKTQKLLDRFLFIFFAEDSGLLPPNSISRIVERWKILKDEDAYKPLYDIFKQYFGYINKGRTGKKSIDSIFAYNGGLFIPDAILDNIKVDDNILLPHALKLTNYDFQSEVDVNILGHIFENSLTEIENITAEIKGQQVDKNKTKRKKDGVYYTPKYITKYIVDNTLGKLCEEKKKELKIDTFKYSENYLLKKPRFIEEKIEGESKAGKIATIKKRKTRLSIEGEKIIKILESYRDFLLNLTICDPACGSGAFLNQALEFLIHEHHILDERISSIKKEPVEFYELEKHILEKNLYGVDINQESVEIAKLSLWLRTAQKKRKLTVLNNNIKCGNSLIDDPEVAGEKAFKWEEEFPKVFEKGGFDVVIGNPPYVRAEFLDLKDKLHFESVYISSFKQYDIYVLFYEKGVNVLREKGLLGFITPNKFYLSDYGIKIRKFLLEKTSIFRITDVSMMNVFQDASVYPTILILENFVDNKNRTIVQSKVTSIIGLEFDTSAIIEQQVFLDSESYEINTNISNYKLLVKIEGNAKNLSELFKMTRGFRPPKDELIYSSSDKGIYPFLTGEALSKPYNVNWNGKYVKYIKEEIPESKPLNILLQPKVMIRDIGLSFNAYFDEGKFLCLKTIYFVYGNSIQNLKFLTCLLNSKLMNFYFKEKYSSMHISGGYLRFRKQFVENMPIIEPNEYNLRNFISLCDNQHITNSNNQLIINQLISFISSKFSLNKLSKKLQKWNLINFEEFLNEIKKIKIKFSLQEESEWMQYFNEQKEKAQAIKSEIEKTDKEIDRMVYALYGLTEEEIRIVEESVG